MPLSDNRFLRDLARSDRCRFSRHRAILLRVFNCSADDLLLRYLSQVYKTLDQNVPDQAKTEAVLDIIAFL